MSTATRISPTAADDPFIGVEWTPERCTAVGHAAVRIDHPWPRDRSSSDVFAEWQWDGSALTVCNDRRGFQPVYYFASKNRIAVSTSIPALLRLGAPLDLDDRALAAFLRLSYFVGTDTPFQAIRALPGGARLIWRPGEGTHVSADAVTERAERLSRESVIDGYVELFRQAVRRRLPLDTDRVILPLSGGRDSRHILFELVRAGSRPDGTVTVHQYPPAGDDDSAIAPHVAAAAGVAHTEIGLDPHRVTLEQRKNLLTGFCAIRHAQMLPLADYLRDRATVIYDGFGGDLLSGTRLELLSQEMALLARGRCEEAATRHLLAHSSEEALNAVLQPTARQRFSFDVASDRVAEELRRHVDAPDPWRSFRIHNKTPRSVALLPFAILARSARVMTPYLDRDLSDFLLALPTAVVEDGQLHAEVIRRAFPEHARIRYEDGQGRPMRTVAYYRRLACDLAREALRTTASPLVRRSFVASRLLRTIATGAPPWISERRVVYLMQLEEIARSAC